MGATEMGKKFKQWQSPRELRDAATGRKNMLAQMALVGLFGGILFYGPGLSYGLGLLAAEVFWIVAGALAAFGGSFVYFLLCIRREVSAASMMSMYAWALTAFPAAFISGSTAAMCIASGMTQEERIPHMSAVCGGIAVVAFGIFFLFGTVAGGLKAYTTL